MINNHTSNLDAEAPIVDVKPEASPKAKANTRINNMLIKESVETAAPVRYIPIDPVKVVEPVKISEPVEHAKTKQDQMQCPNCNEGMNDKTFKI